MAVAFEAADPRGMTNPGNKAAAKLRKELGLTTRECGARFGLTATEWRLVETGHRKPVDRSEWPAVLRELQAAARAKKDGPNT